MCTAVVEYMHQTFHRLLTVHLEAVLRSSRRAQPLLSVIMRHRHHLMELQHVATCPMPHDPRKIFMLN